MLKDPRDELGIVVKNPIKEKMPEYTGDLIVVFRQPGESYELQFIQFLPNLLHPCRDSLLTVRITDTGQLCIELYRLKENARNLTPEEKAEGLGS